MAIKIGTGINLGLGVKIGGYALYATGGTISTYTSGGITYRLHTFTTNLPQDFEVEYGSGTVEYFAVGGGGGGGAGFANTIPGAGGGGGGGGVTSGTLTVSTGTTYTVKAGIRGAPGSAQTPPSSQTASLGEDGSASWIQDGGTYLVYTQGGGGGGGSAYDPLDAPNVRNGRNAPSTTIANVTYLGGGGGGGGFVSGNTAAGGTGGNGGLGQNGGNAASSNGAGAGGGGANVAGGAAVSTAGAGGDGYLSDFSGNLVYYGSGGGGSGGNISTGGAGGSGGGGAGGNISSVPGNGTPNLGHGGGGCTAHGGFVIGGYGGNGVIMIRYALLNRN